ncbi:uncharacterized protein LOC142330816 isoform X1 [Lycorma delicatula]|uniref:uncharacterized protein LOC142330816 isoform X1 n=1 Tax=Lycorma delicatula TaxID=130591 RepID=UPI003F512F77
MLHQRAIYTFKAVINNCNSFYLPRTWIGHHRKLHSILLQRVHKKIRINNVNFCVHRNNTIRYLKTNIITSDNVVTSPYNDINIPACLLHECIWENIDRWPDKIAIEDGITGRKYTFAQIRKYCRTFAASLLKSGLKPGQTVSVILPNIPEYPIVIFGAIEAGLIVSTVNPAYTADELCHQFFDSGSVCAITYAHKLDVINDAVRKVEEKSKKSVSFKIISIQDYDGISREYPSGVWSIKEMMESNIDTSNNIQNNMKPEDIAILPYSSGTTGLPKGVCLTHYNLVSNVCQIGSKDTLMNLPPDGNFQDVLPAVLPFFHIYGLVIILFEALKHGGKLITLPKFEPETYIKTLNNHKSTVLFTVPPLFLFLGCHPGIKKSQFENVRYVLSAAAPLGLSDIERCEANFPKDVVFKQGYGLTETSPITMISGNKNKILTSVGPPVSKTEVKVINYNTGQNLGIEEHGEICIRGPQVMKGYLNRSDATHEIIDKDGWLHSGDIGYYDKNGYFYIVDRIKELIKVKGFQVAPAELEELLRCHPKVADVAVIGVPDAKAGEVPVAFVVPQSESEIPASEELISYIDEKVTKYKRLSKVVFTDSIPKNPSGKILRRKLKNDFIKAAQ